MSSVGVARCAACLIVFVTVVEPTPVDSRFGQPNDIDRPPGDPIAIGLLGVQLLQQLFGVCAELLLCKVNRLMCLLFLHEQVLQLCDGRFELYVCILRNAKLVGFGRFDRHRTMHRSRAHLW